jgi:competence protein CoiA
MADVRTEHGLVIEFQHSHINPRERTSRENFYKSIVWIADGTRLKSDIPRFLKAKPDFRPTNQQGIFYVDFAGECFPSDWLNSLVPVIFDFKGIGSAENDPDIGDNLYCLFPIRIGRYAVLAMLSRKIFIDTALNGEFLKWAVQFMAGLKEAQKLQHQREMMIRQQQGRMMMQKLRRPVTYRRYRRS